MDNIAIVGVGSLGRRHLESMIELKDEYTIYAVEANHEAISRLEEEFPDVNFSETIDGLPKRIEAVVIATNANVRREVFEDLIGHSYVSNIVFEKVLFQREDDYMFVKNKLDELGINAWVNCARREWDSYKTFKSELDSCNEIHLSAIGGKWGMGSSAIHILDLVEYLSNSKVDKVNVDKLDDIIEESKRKGFYEFFGTITGCAGRCKNFSITCINKSSLPFRIEITTEKSRYMIDEVHNYIMVSNEKSGWDWEKRDFKQVYQSQMTGRVLKSIISEHKCNLVDYDSSMNLHLKLLKALYGFFKKNGMGDAVCPIT